ncbi:MAG: aldo/keto reductase [Proteobacteria bacterium]|nr:aldo/keto reductase [Pseudomonadota bacterium]MCP4917435.1 aldo/keto reductase [Pseudomonadota bacterium]
MITNNLGRSGLKVSRFSIGSWVTYGGQVDDSVATACIHAALDAGVNFIDNAEAYAQGAAEVTVGKVIKGMRRESLVVSSKVFWGGDGPNDTGLNRKHVVEACHGALRRLQLDYLDLYFCHRHDPTTPVDEVVRTMNTLIQQGKILYWGTSEWTAPQLQEAFDCAERLGLEGPTMEQPQYNMLHRARVEDELGPLIDKYGLGTTIWSPLASGLLTGKYDDGVPEDSRLAHMEWLQEFVFGETKDSKIAKVRALADVAGDLGCTRAQLALAWCAKNPQVSTVLTGASRVEQVHENMKALDVLEKLDDGVMQRIEGILA